MEQDGIRMTIDEQALGGMENLRTVQDCFQASDREEHTFTAEHPLQVFDAHSERPATSRAVAA